MEKGSETVTAHSHWKTKPSDRFILRWIKLHLSARITPVLARIRWISPTMVTCTSAAFGITGGLILGLGFGWQGGLIAGIGQILDGVDGQLARYTSRESPLGGFLDSLLDRYGDGFLVVGLTVFSIRSLTWIEPLYLVLLGTIAFISSNSVSYSVARAQNMGVHLRPTLASKGTRTTVIVISALATSFWPGASILGILYLVIHPSLAVARRSFEMARACRGQAPSKPRKAAQ